jgi:hypothetical protein
MTNKEIQPKWGDEENEMVARYEKRLREGNIEEFVIIPKD